MEDGSNPKTGNSEFVIEVESIEEQTEEKVVTEEEKSGKGASSGWNPTSPTPYDDVFRTLEQELVRLFILFLNLMFDEHYTGEEEVSHEKTEFMVMGADGKWHKRVLDNLCTVHGAEAATQYHVECQSTTDEHLSDRFCQYDTAAALENVLSDENHQHGFRLPRSGVLYLRPPANLNGDIQYFLESPQKNGTERFYVNIKVLCPNDYSVEDLLLPDHLIMLPFFLFRYGSKLKKLNPEKKSHVLDNVQKLRDGLQALRQTGTIDAYEERTLREMCLTVSEHIAKDDDIRKGVHRIMGGRVLNYEAKQIHDAGKAEGYVNGKADGYVNGKADGYVNGKADGSYETKSDTVRKMRDEKLPVDMIARVVGWSEEEVLAVT